MFLVWFLVHFVGCLYRKHVVTVNGGSTFLRNVFKLSFFKEVLTRNRRVNINIGLLWKTGIKICRKLGWVSQTEARDRWRKSINIVVDKFKEKYYFGNCTEVRGKDNRKSLVGEWEKGWGAELPPGQIFFLSPPRPGRQRGHQQTSSVGASTYLNPYPTNVENRVSS